jgi:GTP-binding protein
MSKIVAIIGRPNVGKSTLFNRLIGKKIAIVHDIPGVTRDRNYGEVEWNGKKFFLIDTGGYVPSSKDTFEAAIREQVQISLDEADVVLFVADAQEGVTPLDKEIAAVLRKETGSSEKKGKRVFLVLNKIDSAREENLSTEFYKLGLGEPVEVSALVGRKSGDLLDKITEDFQYDLPAEALAQAGKSAEIKLAIIGRPNVGKSSLVNAITQSSRNIVTPIPGTTRDSTDTILKYYGKKIVLIDTAGLRKKSKIRKAESLEYYSAIRTQRSIERCDVSVIIIDALNITFKLDKSSDYSLASFKLDKLDVEIITESARLKKGVLVVINKWDLIEKSSTTTSVIENKLKEHLKTYDYLPVIFVSALTKQRVSSVLKSAVDVYYERARNIKTSELNNKMLKVIKATPPSSKSHKEIKINYITQLKSSPPVICFFTNLPSEIGETYKRFLENKLRQFWGFNGVPLTLVFKRKN